MMHALETTRAAAPAQRPALPRAIPAAHAPVAEEERAPAERRRAHSFAQVRVHAAPRPPAEGGPPSFAAPRLSLSAASVLRRACACGGTPGPGGECEACRRKRVAMQRSASASAPEVAPAIVHQVLRSHGQPLDARTRAEMEPRFGHSFAHVRVHADGQAAESARAVGAHAYAVGGDIVFAAGRYAPGSRDGRRLIAHELAHVVQQGGAGSASIQPRLEIGAVDDPAEREAEAAAERVLADAPSAALGRQAGLPRLRRLGDLSKVPPGLPCTVATTSASPAVVDILFPRDVSTLTSGDRSALDAFVGSWHAMGGHGPVRVDGFASEDGEDGPNWSLSCARARAVTAELRSPSSGATGITSAQLQEFAQGETTEFGGRPANRRATVTSPAAPPPTPAPPTPTTPTTPTGPSATTVPNDAGACTPGRPGIPPSPGNCAAYAASGWWLPTAYVWNASCACLTTPNSTTANCVRQVLQDRLAATPPTLVGQAAIRKSWEGTALHPLYVAWVVDNLTPRIYLDHVIAYRSCCCPSGPASRGAWIGVSTVPLPSCSLVWDAIRFAGSCHGTLGSW
jgi:outer membrane protein OmpA-like peptidoglycan-associated protein